MFSKASLIIIAMSLLATAARSDGISSNFIGRDVFGGVSFTGKITAPPTGCHGVIDQSAGCPLPMMGN
jgi:hypothetical protein